jgi:hypothetical protein
MIVAIRGYETLVQRSLQGVVTQSNFFKKLWVTGYKVILYTGTSFFSPFPINQRIHC